MSEPVRTALDLAPLLPGLRRLAEELYGNRALPRVVPVRQRIDSPRLADVEGAAVAAVDRVVATTARRGPIAVGIGSRGITNLDRIARAVIGRLREAGFEPFVVPAMGSHGGATAAGQAAVLAHYGIDEVSLGVPVRATMETRVIGEVAGLPVHFDRHAAECGQVFLIARVKPHTDFVGSIESGLAKMAAIGLGKQKGASLMHSGGVPGLRDVMPAAARLIADSGLLLGGVAIIENARDETASIHGVLPTEIGREAEARLLAEASRLIPRIPFQELDVLIVDRMGKDISGTGMDTKVLNRLRVLGEPEPPGLRIATIVALDLTEASEGNGIGVGLADFMPARCVEKIDLAVSYTNVLTAGLSGVKRGHLPIVMPDDRFSILAAIACSGRVAGAPLRLCWIQDTLHTETMAISEDLLREAGGELEVIGPARDLPIDSAGRLEPLGVLAGR